MLAALQTALFEIVERGSQSYTVALPGGGSRTFTALDIDKLQKLIATYEAQASRSSRRIFAGIQFQGAQ